MITDDALDLAIISQMAGQGFVQYGRGCLLILMGRKTAYFPATQIAELEHAGQQRLPDLHCFVATYTPQRQAVVAMVDVQPDGWSRMELAIITLRGIGHANEGH